MNQTPIEISSYILYSYRLCPLIMNHLNLDINSSYIINDFANLLCAFRGSLL